MMRKALYELLTKDEEFISIIPRVYERGSVPDAPETPFCVTAWGLREKPGPGQRVNLLEIWFHDDRGDYSVIDQGVKRAKELIENAVHYYSEDETSVITQASWEGDSADLNDDGYRTNTITSTYRVTGGTL